MHSTSYLSSDLTKTGIRLPKLFQYEVQHLNFHIQTMKLIWTMDPLITRPIKATTDRTFNNFNKSPACIHD